MIFGKSSWYYQCLTKQVATFAAFFDDIVIKRFDPSGHITADIKVPIEFAHKEKMMTRLLSDPQLQRNYAALLPRISYEITNIRYAPERKLNSVNRKVQKNSANSNLFAVEYNPVPYDINFNVYVYTKNIEDGNKIVEQILPFFTPDYTVTIEFVPDINDYRDVPVVIQNVMYEDKYDGKFEERQMTIWTIQFVMHGFLFGPVKQKPMIKFTTINYRLDNDVPIDSNGVQLAEFPTTNTSDPITEVQTDQPGLLANGSPTTNAAASIPYNQIFVDQPWDDALTLTIEIGQ